MAATPASAERLEQAVLGHINRVRAQPHEVADELRRYRAAFDGRVTHENGDPIGVETFEGVRAVDEAIAFLDREEPLPPLADGPVLARTAQDWAAAQGAAGAMGHGFGGGSPGARVRTSGGDIYVAETISYGMTTAASVVRQLIVDNGQPQRGHRALVFLPGSASPASAAAGMRAGARCA